jgi:hypothetical protein
MLEMIRGLQNNDVGFICMYERPTMSPEEAADAVLAFHPEVSIPCPVLIWPFFKRNWRAAASTCAF